MSSIIRCRGIFYKFGCSGKECKEAFNFRVQIEDAIKSVKKIQKSYKVCTFCYDFNFEFLFLGIPIYGSTLNSLFSYFQSKANRSLA